MFPTLLTPLARWGACRHHTMELLVKAAYHELFGDSKSPDVKLFTLLKDPATWNSLELNNFRPPLIPRAYKDDVEPILHFTNKQLDGENQDKLPRGDYKEFLELAKIFLGGDVDRKKGYIFQLSRPGADHHARWTSKCIYFLKLFLLSDQFPQSQLSWQKKKKVETMAIFIIFPYLQSWFTSPSLLEAVQNDLDLFKRLQMFSKIDKKISSATSTVLSRHPWYLTEELIPIQHQPTCGGAHITGQKDWIPPSSQSEGLQAPPTSSNCRLLPAGLCWASFNSSVQPLGDNTYLPA